MLIHYFISIVKVQMEHLSEEWGLLMKEMEDMNMHEGSKNIILKATA